MWLCDKRGEGSVLPSVAGAALHGHLPRGCTMAKQELGTVKMEKGGLGGLGG